MVRCWNIEMVLLYDGQYVLLSIHCCNGCFPQTIHLFKWIPKCDRLLSFSRHWLSDRRGVGNEIGLSANVGTTWSAHATAWILIWWTCKLVSQHGFFLWSSLHCFNGVQSVGCIYIDVFLWTLLKHRRLPWMTVEMHAHRLGDLIILLLLLDEKTGIITLVIQPDNQAKLISEMSSISWISCLLSWNP